MPELSLALDIIAGGRKRAFLQCMLLFPDFFFFFFEAVDVALSLRVGNGILHDNSGVTRLCP